MNDDELRDRIARLDPALGGVPTNPYASDSARALLEDIMSTTPDTIDETPFDVPAGPRDSDANRRRTWWALGAAAAIVAVVAVGIGVSGGGGDDDQPLAVDPTVTTPGKATVLELEAGTEDLMASCMVLDPSVVAQAPVAFAGTVTMADGEVVQLTVDEAFAGVDADVVTLTAPTGMEPLIGGVNWVVGEQYLVSAYDGVVAYCNQTGPATAELRAVYDAAFPS